MKTPWLRTLLLCIVSLAFAAQACDEGSSSTDDDTSNDMTTPDGGDMTNPDGGDMTDPDGDMAEPDGTDMTDPDGTDMTDPDSTDMSMDMVEELPIEWPATPEAYTAGSVAYLNSLTIPELDNENTPVCCYDFGAISKDNINDGTDKIDNAFAALANAIEQILNLQTLLDDQLADEEGPLIILWDHQMLDGEDDADGFVLAGLFGELASGTVADAMQGGGEFLINPSSFIGTTGEPMIAFNPATMQGGEMTAGPGTFVLTLPLGSVPLAVQVESTRVTGSATVDAAGVDYSSGTLAGYIELEDLFGALNAFAGSDDCACLGLSGDLYEYDAVAGTVSANCASNHTCNTTETEACAQVGSGMICSLLPNVFISQADIDTNGDPEVYEALSVGLEWTAVDGTITGVAAP